jgi:hypothetical protein
MIAVRALFVIASAALTATATPVFWTLSGVTSLGTTITGSFTFNADTLTYSAVDIVTTGGSFIPSEIWTNLAGCCSTEAGFLGLVDTSAANQTGANLLGLFFQTNLSNAGGTIPITETQQGVCAATDCGGFNAYPGDPSGGNNSVVTGNAVATPEPSSLALFGAGAALLVAIRNRHATKALSKKS